jgi:uncharacterized protein (DUF885 family)
VAWAQHKGVAAVEVRVDGGAWQEARLAAVPDIDTWRQWVWEWDATPGNHLLEARATDATGYTQTALAAQPVPNGASGYPSAAVTVRSSLSRGIWVRPAVRLSAISARAWSKAASLAAGMPRVASAITSWPGARGGVTVTQADRQTGGSMSGDADAEFTKLAQEYLDDRAERHPDLATGLGDHRFDARLPDPSEAALASERRALDGWTARLEELDTEALSAEHRVDAAMMADSVARRVFEIDELAEHTWNPLLANPGRAVYLLLARDFAPLPDRLASLAGRLAEVPGTLAEARRQLGPMPRVHLETAIGQFDGTIALVGKEIDAALAAAPTSIPLIDQVRPAALEALAEHQAWLSARLAEAAPGPDGDRNPRIGPERFARKLSLTLSAAADADAIRARARADLDRIGEQIAELAGQIDGSARPGPATVRQVLDRLARDVPDDATILGFCRDALAAQIAFVSDRQLVTVYDDPVEVIPMPEIDRGVAVAYCDSPGPLETAPLATFLAVSPTPAEWPPERVASFYREYNRHMVHNLMVHEAMPGHYLQQQHSRRFTGSGAAIRAALRSGSFVEGWAVYAERIMAEHGYPGDGDPRAVRMQQLKMQLRTTINAILDAGIHGHGMTEAEAMTLMTSRGHQEEGEAAGKWRRALLTSAQLSTYYVGYTEISDLADELRMANPGLADREIHDRMLAHGSPPVRLLRTLIAP